MELPTSNDFFLLFLFLFNVYSNNALLTIILIEKKSFSAHLQELFVKFTCFLLFLKRDPLNLQISTFQTADTPKNYPFLAQNWAAGPIQVVESVRFILALALIMNIRLKTTKCVTFASDATRESVIYCLSLTFRRPPCENFKRLISSRFFDRGTLKCRLTTIINSANERLRSCFQYCCSDFEHYVNALF